MRHSCLCKLYCVYIVTCYMEGWQKCVAFFGWLSIKSYECNITVTGWTASTTLVLQLRFFLFCICVSPQLSLSFSLYLHSSSSSSLKGVRPDVDGESEGGAGLVAALVAEQRVNWHHLQVQRVLSGPGHSAGQHQHGADIIDLLEKTKQILLSTFLQQGRNTTSLWVTWGF